ncbi:MAG: serine hydrolase domain-containing protein [Anaerolineae bacterium]|nr:serine hydrolase domain-containing protein [Anaerolineae bacterium]
MKLRALQPWLFCLKISAVFLLGYALLALIGSGGAPWPAMAQGSNDLTYWPPGVATTSAPDVTAPVFTTIDRYVESEMKATRLPGLALAIVQANKIVHVKGFGLADSSGRPVTPQTPFNIASTGKSMTALAIMQLVEAGQIDLDAPVRHYVPWFRVADATASDKITVRHLLTHTSGLSRETGLTFLGRRNNSDGALEERVQALSTVKLFQPPGTSFQYSNANYSTLGLIVQTVVGQPYEQVVQAHIFGPLQMKNTFTTLEAARRHGAATGYRYWWGRPLPYEMRYHRGEVPAGFIWSSAEDMARYLIVQLNGGRYGDVQLLSPAGVAELHRPAVLARLASNPADTDIYYGLGWKVGTINGVPSIYHEGSGGNFHATMILLPEERWGVVLLMNAENGLKPEQLKDIASGVVSLLVGRQPSTTTSDTMQLTFFRYTLGLMVVQLLGILRTVWLLHHWRAEPTRRPSGWLRVGWHIVPPLILNILWGVMALGLVPRLLGGTLTNLITFVPDFGYTLILSGVVALIWGIVRTILVGLTLRGEARSTNAAFAPQDFGILGSLASRKG